MDARRARGQGDVRPIVDDYRNVDARNYGPGDLDYFARSRCLEPNLNAGRAPAYCCRHAIDQRRATILCVVSDGHQTQDPRIEHVLSAVAGGP